MYLYIMSATACFVALLAGIKLDFTTLVPNVLVRKLAREWLEAHLSHCMMCLLYPYFVISVAVLTGIKLA
jgi:hypothetical protein